jgi:predicted ATP-grasp superfamily ATP-dependent carboligase
VAERLLIVGASGRAAAASALRAGFVPAVVDLFADEDTQAIAPVLACGLADYPHGFIPLARQFPPGPWLYTGGLENHPDVLRILQQDRPLLGIGPEFLHRHRSPQAFHDLLQSAGVRVPALASPGQPRHGSWLVKSASAGGFGTRFATPRDWHSLPPDAVLQEFVPGVPMSAVFFSRPGEATLFGTTRQLIGEPWLHAPAFRYAGNLVENLPTPAQDELRELAQLLTTRCHLVGIWGLDFLWHDGLAWYLELNPRYVASAEVLELATGVSAVRGHVTACRGEPLPVLPPPMFCVGKAIYYAAADRTVPRLPRSECFADRPAPGSMIPAGQPILTILSSGDSLAECDKSLHQAAEELDRVFDFPTFLPE